jgi:hypothetical protein
MKKKDTLYAVAAGLGLLYFMRGGTNPPPPPPPIECPIYYSSDGTKCVPNTPAQTQSWSFLVDPNNVDTNGVEMAYTLRIPNGFTGCIIIHAQATNATTHEQVDYEIWQQTYSNYGGGYINRIIRLDFPASNTLYNVFSYVTNCTVSERYTGVIFKGVMTK